MRGFIEVSVLVCPTGASGTVQQYSSTVALLIAWGHGDDSCAAQKIGVCSIIVNTRRVSKWKILRVIVIIVLRKK